MFFLEQLVDKVFEMDLDDIENFNFPLNERFGLRVMHNNTEYCFLVRFVTDNDKLICIGSGSQPRNEKNFDRPTFQRHSWYSEFDASVIYYSDPIFLRDNTVNCGWCVGTPKEYYLDYIKRIIEKLCLNRKIKYKNILFYGSSAGGFTSIQLGTFFKESVVLANNPQIDVRNFNDNHYKKLLDLCFKNMDRNQVEEHYEHRLNVIANFKKEKYIPNIYYLLELYSEVDFERNLTPFLFNLNSLDFFNKSNSIQIMIYNRYANHTPLNKKDTIRVINHISNGDFLSLSNISYLKMENGVEFSIPPGFYDAHIPTENKLRFINKNNERILIHEYSKNSILSERIYNNQIKSLEDDGHLILVKDSFIINSIRVYMLNFQDEQGIRTFFYFDRFNNSYLVVFYNFTSRYQEIELIKNIIGGMKKEKFIY